MQKTALRYLVWSENERALNFRVRVDVYVELLITLFVFRYLVIKCHRAVSGVIDDNQLVLQFPFL